MIKSVWIQAYFKDEGHWETRNVRVGTKKHTAEKGLFRKKIVEMEVPVYEDKKVWISKNKSDKIIDGERLSNDLKTAADDATCFAWGYGFSYTEGFTILAKKA